MAPWPHGDGIEATRRIVSDSPSVRVQIVTMFEDDATVFRAMRAGARGYVPKGANYAEMLRAIKAVGDGEAVFGPQIASRLAEYFATIRPAAAPDLFPEPSDRECEVLGLLAEGLKNPEIARRLYLSPKTVRNHVSTILHKLRVARIGRSPSSGREKRDWVVRSRLRGLPEEARRPRKLVVKTAQRQTGGMVPYIGSSCPSSASRFLPTGSTSAPISRLQR